MPGAGVGFTVKRKIFISILVTFIVAWTAFIFSNSLKDADASDLQSGGIVDFIIKNIFRVFDEEQRAELVGVVTLIVRKSAHFIEYAVLSSLLFSCFYVLRKKTLSCFVLSMPCVLVVAVIDEMLQTLSDGRACRFYDVLIDSCGGLFGCFFICAVAFIIKRFKKV